MQELQLYIEGQRIELFKDESVSITQTIQNVKDIAKIFTSFTKTFSVPATKTNNKIFKHYYNYNIVDGYDARIKKNGIIELNFLPYKTGRIKLEGVDLKNNLAHTYRITFFGNTVELPDILGDDKLGSLFFASSDYTQTYNQQTIKAFFASQQGNGKLIVPFITHTQRLFYNSSTTNVDNLHYNQNSQQGVYYDQLKFALRLYEIILEIETKYTTANGYANNIVFSRDFFSTSNPEFYNLYMWLHRKSGYVQAPQQIVNYTTSTSGWSPQGIDNIITSFNTIVVPASAITNPNAIIDNQLTVTPASGNSQEYQVQVRESGNVIFTSTARTGTTNISLQYFVPNGVYTVTILHTTQVNFSGISWFFEGFTRNTGQAPVGWVKTVTIGAFNAVTEFDFIVAEQIPDVSIMSFLTGLFKMFNLVAYVDDEGTIVVRPLDGAAGVDYSYYTSADINGNDAPVNYNISEYVDVTKSQVNVALPYKEIIYRYEGTGTFLAKQFQQLDGRAWGSLPYIGGTNSDGTGGINYNASTKLYEVKVPFEHMQYERLLNGSNGALIDPMWGWSVNENAQSYIGKPLIFYATLKTNGTPISYQTSTTGTGKVSVNAYWIPSNSLYLDATQGTQNINFAFEQNEYQQSQNFNDTLFADYHSQYIIDVFNRSRRITKVSAILPLKILFNFKLNDTFTINSRNYIINSITTNLQNGKSEMELLNKVSNYSLSIQNITYQGTGGGILWYRSSIGIAPNLSVGDYVYTNKELTTTPSSGSYTQAGSAENSTFCSAGYQGLIVVDSNGKITSKTCGQP